MCTACSDTTALKQSGTIVTNYPEPYRTRDFPPVAQPLYSGVVEATRQLCNPGSHDYKQADGQFGAAALMFCSRCGDVAKLSVPSD